MRLSPECRFALTLACSTVRRAYRPPPHTTVRRGGSSHSGNPGNELEVRLCLEMTTARWGLRNAHYIAHTLTNSSEFGHG